MQSTKKISNQNLSNQNVYFRIFTYVALLLVAALILFPLYMVVIIAFKSSKEYLYSTLLSLPESFLYFDNFIKVINSGKIFLGFKNTIILVVFSVSLSILMGLMVSYVLNRFDFRFKKLVMVAFVSTAIIPNITTQVAVFQVITALKLYNTIYAGILLYIATDIIQIYFFLQYFRKIPKELDESGMVDGASYFRIFRSILVPQMVPAIVTMSIIKAITIYNDIFIPYLYMPSGDLRTVSTALQSFQLLRGTEWTTMSAAILFTLAPTLIVYIACQKIIISGLTEGAVKG